MIEGLELAIQCRHFHKRMCWSLSSVLQQRGHRPLVNVACVAEDGDTLDALDVLERAGTPIKRTVYPDETEFKFRGLTRNRALAESTRRWMMFGDADIVYHPDYFQMLLEAAAARGDFDRILFSRKRSTKLVDAEPLVAAENYPSVISGAYGKAEGLPGHYLSLKCAGFCQVVSVPYVRGRFGSYTPDGQIVDKDWSVKAACPKSDRIFRTMMGGKEYLELPDMIHLNHIRDMDSGAHTTVAR